jgi:hypothetical protein
LRVPDARIPTATNSVFRVFPRLWDSVSSVADLIRGVPARAHRGRWPWTLRPRRGGAAFKSCRLLVFARIPHFDYLDCDCHAESELWN